MLVCATPPTSYANVAELLMVVPAAVPAAAAFCAANIRPAASKAANPAFGGLLRVLCFISSPLCN
jgi:hypothetical protein